MHERQLLRSPAAPPHPPDPGKTAYILVRPGLEILRADIDDVSAGGVALLLGRPLPAGAEVTFLDRDVSSADPRFLPAHVHEVQRRRVSRCLVRLTVELVRLQRQLLVEERDGL